MYEQNMSKIFTPQEHILFAEAYKKAGVVFIRIKKSGKNVVEDIPLDELLSLIFSAVYPKIA